MSSRIIIIAGWAHGTESLSALCSLLAARYSVKATSTAKLFSARHANVRALPSVSQYATTLYEMISKSEEPPILIAWSMGAIVAIETIAKLSPEISRLILVSGTARFYSDVDYQHGVPEKNLRAMALSLASNPDETLTSFLRDAAFPKLESQSEIEKRSRKALSFPADCLNDGLAYLRHTDLRRELPKIQVPTLILHGRQDKIIPSSAGEFLRDNIPGSNLIIHDNTGHSMLLDQPVLIAENMRQFLES
jgi:pimeloyl-[acyl-carrier protein] methyl ester esterase